jgi:hypothetical protein
MPNGIFFNNLQENLTALPNKGSFSPDEGMAIDDFLNN